MLIEQNEDMKQNPQEVGTEDQLSDLEYDNLLVLSINKKQEELNRLKLPEEWKK